MHTICFNDFSITTPQGNLDDVKSTILNFTSLILNLNSLSGNPNPLIVESGLINRNLGFDYTFANWIADKTVNIESRRLLLSSLTRGPFIPEGFHYENGNLEVFVNNQTSNNFLYGYVNNAMFVGFNYCGNWGLDRINISVSSYSITSDSIIQSSETVPHISNTQHVSLLQSWITNCNTQYLLNFDNFIESYKVFFPNIYFNESSLQAIEVFSREQALFSNLIAKIFILQKYATSTQSQEINIAELRSLGLIVKRESNSTMQQFGNQREFRVSDNSKVKFTFHFDLNPGARRAYIKWNSTNGNVEFGYIGNHLKIVSEG